MRVLLLLTARGGSVRLPRKNVLPLHGIPLIQHTVEAALNCGIPGADVICSTDDREIAEVVTSCAVDVPFLRPPELSTPEASSLDVVLHVLDWCKEHRDASYNAVILLQPTSPFRNARHIREAFELFQSKKAVSLASVCPAISTPYKMYNLSESGTLEKLIPFRSASHRKQDYPTVYQENGAIFIFTPEHLRRTSVFVSDESIPYVMDQLLSLDIDTEDDMFLAESLFSRLNSR